MILVITVALILIILFKPELVDLQKVNTLMLVCIMYYGYYISNLLLKQVKK